MFARQLLLSSRDCCCGSLLHLAMCSKVKGERVRIMHSFSDVDRNEVLLRDYCKLKRVILMKAVN